MADTVTSQTITDVSGSKTVMKFTNLSDGSGESLVQKMDASELNHVSSSAKIARVVYNINCNSGNGAVEILFDGATNATGLVLSGTGIMDLQTPAIQIANNATTPTGDILFSTKNFVSGDSYSIILELR
jgi:hypothetical protein